jgi:hypothetical protein
VGNVIASRRSIAAALALAAAAVGGCSETMPLAQLPDIARLPQKVLSQAEQQGKVDEMNAKAQRHQDEAVKEIERNK